MEIRTEIICWIIVAIFLHLMVLLFLRKSPKKSIKNSHVVVTGGSSGIGLRIAINAAKLGADVTIIARNKVALEKSVKLIKENCQNEAQKIEYKSIDLSKSYDDVAKGFAEIEEKSGDIYMLVNCAGQAICGTIEDMSIEDSKKMMDINYYATFYPTRYVIPKMKAAGRGIIVITASQAALIGIYGYGAYAASKFALRGLAETLAMETAHKGITVTLALPSDTNTPGFELEEKTKPKETKIISGSGGLADPEAVAKQILNDALVCCFFLICRFLAETLKLFSQKQLIKKNLKKHLEHPNKYYKIYDSLIFLYFIPERIIFLNSWS